MADPSPEQRELTLIEKVDFRIVNAANNEKKLQDLLKTYLVPLLVKAKSEHASVRNKVRLHPSATGSWHMQLTDALDCSSVSENHVVHKAGSVC